MSKKIFSLKNFGKYLKNRRVHAGLTQSEVAAKLRYTTGQFVSNWETGRSSPPFSILYKLAGLYRIPTRELYDVVLKHYQEGLAEALKLKKSR